MAPHQVLAVTLGLASGPSLRAEPPPGPLTLKPGLTEASGLPGPSPHPQPLAPALSSWLPGSFWVGTLTGASTPLPRPHTQL